MSNSNIKPEFVEKKLKGKIKGEVSADEITRYFYSTDASVYRIMPTAVVYPKDKKDVIEVIKFANKHGISIHPRGAGSGLGGASLGPGIILAFRRYMNDIIEIDIEARKINVKLTDKEIKERIAKAKPPKRKTTPCSLSGA